MNWRIVILEDYTVELVPTELLNITLDKCWRPRDRSLQNFQTAHKEFKDRIKHVLEETFDRQGGEQKLEQLYKSILTEAIESRVKELIKARSETVKKINEIVKKMRSSATKEEKTESVKNLEAVPDAEDVFRRFGSDTREHKGLRIIDLSQTSLQIQNGFEHLKSEFFKSCEDENATETFWIIKVTKTGDDNEGVEFFAAAKDEAKAEPKDDAKKPRPVEKVFIDWWDLYIKNRWYDNVPSCRYQFKVYSNRRLSDEGKKSLKDWLQEEDRVDLSIHYVFNNNDVARDETETEQTFKLEELEKEISLKMDWQIVILEDDTVELVPTKLLEVAENKCWLPDERNLEGLTTAVENVEEWKKADTEEAPKNYKSYVVKCIFEGAADYLSGRKILKKLSAELKRTVDREENATGSDAAVVAHGSSESDLAPKENLNLVQLSQTSLQFQNGFEYLVSKFNLALDKQFVKSAFWIIKLTKTCDEGSEYTFAAAKNDWGERHVEEVFTDWWESGQKHDYENTLEVYTNNAPSSNCAEHLNRWLLLEPPKEVTLSINYKYSHPSYQISQIKKKLKSSIDAGKLTIEKIEDGSLKQLADDIRERM